MTSNQIAAKEAKERARSNRAQERETARSNRAKERLTDKDIETKRYAANVNAASNLAGSAIKVGMGNSPEWYNLDKQMVSDVASISYETPLGYGVKPGTKLSTLSNVDDLNPSQTSAVSTSNLSIPGVVGLQYIPTLGNDNIVRTAALNIYAYVRHANSGSRNYEFQDLMKYLYAVDSVYIGIAELKRIYSILNTYKGYNRFYAMGYIKAMGYDPDTFKNINLAALRYGINELVQSVNALYVPNVMSMYLRHDWMSTNIYKDSPIKRSSNYMFVAKYIYRYNEDVDTKGFGCLEPVSLSTDNTLEGILARVSEVLNVLKRSEDIGIISGDILKAYGNNNMFLVKNIDTDYHVEEIYSPEVLTQINGATTFFDIYLPSFKIYEDENGNLKQGYNSDKVENSEKGLFNINGNTLPFALAIADYPISKDATSISVPEKDLIINMYKDDVTPDDNMVATRLMVATDVRAYPSNQADKYYSVYRIKACGTEVCIRAEYVCFRENGDFYLAQLYDGRAIYTADGSQGDVFSSLVSCLDWAPRFRQYLISSTGSYGNGFLTNKVTLLCDNKDLCNYAVINDIVLDRMHRVAVNSELGVPLLGMQVRK